MLDCLQQPTTTTRPAMMTLVTYPRRRDLEVLNPDSILDEYSRDGLEITLFQVDNLEFPFAVNTKVVETEEDGEVIPEGDEWIFVNEVYPFRTLLEAEEAFRSEVGAIGNPGV